MGQYIKNDERCDHCLELAKRPRGEGVPETWHDGTPIKPLKNKSRGTICADCRWWDFDDFCRSQGCTAAHPIVHIP